MSNKNALGSDSTIRRVEGDRLEVLALKLREGLTTHDEREEISKSFIRLALSVANRYAGGNSNKADDYASAGLFGIVWALEHAVEKLNEYHVNEPDVSASTHLSKWVSSCINRYIKEFRWKDHVVVVPQKAATKARSEGKDILVTTITGHTAPVNSSHDQLRKRKRSYTPEYEQKAYIKDSTKLAEVKELLELSVNDERDALIIQMRLEGYTDTEIAEHIGISCQAVSKRGAKIEERYTQLECN